MSLEALVTKYIASAELVLLQLEMAEASCIDESEVGKVVDSAKAYLADAKHYRNKKEFGVSLASVSYCEGLLDALKMLGAVRFEWPAGTKRKSGK
jgi:FAD synthetase